MTFHSHVDGSAQRLTPESAMAMQADLGSDIAMAFDECPASHASGEVLRRAMERTTRWARRCVAASPAPGQLRFAIVQGGTDIGLRAEHLAAIAEMSFDGVALGGLSVGEPPETMHAVVRQIAPRMPDARPRYLMGVGTPADLLAAITSGIDMFDCVMPTRAARNGRLFAMWKSSAPNIPKSRFISMTKATVSIRTARPIMMKPPPNWRGSGRWICFARMGDKHNLSFPAERRSREGKGT